jgi:hypothetical protein
MKGVSAGSADLIISAVTALAGGLGLTVQSAASPLPANAPLVTSATPLSAANAQTLAGASAAKAAVPAATPVSLIGHGYQPGELAAMLRAIPIGA